MMREMAWRGEDEGLTSKYRVRVCTVVGSVYNTKKMDGHTKFQGIPLNLDHLFHTSRTVFRPQIRSGKLQLSCSDLQRAD